MINSNNIVIYVNHKDLRRSGKSLYRSVCPVCREGVLLVQRFDDGNISKDDMCILCGQRYFYLDLKNTIDGFTENKRTA